jgi:hypothetical protein
MKASNIRDGIRGGYRVSSGPVGGRDAHPTAGKMPALLGGGGCAAQDDNPFSTLDAGGFAAPESFAELTFQHFSGSSFWQRSFDKLH